mgnify:CR=1 FL=1
MNGQLDIISICLLCVIFAAGALFLMRMMGGGGGLGGRGVNRPSVDDPDIESRGGFGDSGGTGYPRGRGGSIFPPLGGRGQSAGNQYPGRRGGSLFPPLGGRRGASRRGGADRPRNDDPDINSRGGFGR